ncbi:biotin/lipoyl-binding protein [Flavobacteriaceae bacterium MJ-SS4]|uniref:HlyD family secretion protein n=1 Tax=Gilvirhabdus luticola TaxID=3079858 RepID=UPI0032DC9181
MLNISENKLNKKVDLNEFKSVKKVFNKTYYKVINKFLILFMLVAIVIMFLPWTQTVSSNGNVTTLLPNQRPHTIQSPIPGKIEKWFIVEGDYVNMGDTIVQISEIKSEYFDPNLVERTREQIVAKSSSINSYDEKANALKNQIKALKDERIYKLDQAKNKLQQAEFKVKSDSIDWVAFNINKDVALSQYNRELSLASEGLKSQKDVENKNLKLQEAQAKAISAENKYLISRSELRNSEVELSRINAEYADKVAKVRSELYTAESGQFETVAQISKLENEFSNYQIRSNLLYIIASQSGYINKTIKSGLGETIKEGEQLVGIMPAQYDLAVESYVRPIDLPLLRIGDKIRIQFDGWPAVVFSGWPNISYGTYGGKVLAIENFISPNGKYRILIAPDESDHTWPELIRVGSGAKTIALLSDVPIWFELWRNLNGFPPNYYGENSIEKIIK